MQDIIIQFQGFHPSEFTRSYLDSKLSDLSAEAPDGSTLRAVFKRRNKMLIAQVRILTHTGMFFVSANGTHLREVTHKLNERARRQLRRWKDLRTRKGGGSSDDPSVA
jgi:hypothetical protein